MLFGAKGVAKPGVIADSDQHVGVSSAGIDQIGIGDCEMHLIEEVPRVTDDAAHTQILKRVSSNTQVLMEQQATTILAAQHYEQAVSFAEKLKEVTT